jgi:predicted hydrocarbon binding protein
MKGRNKQKKSTARKRIARPRKVPLKVIPPLQDEINYERALAKHVMDSNDAPESEDAATLAAALSSLTASLKKVSYNYGLTVGRSIYKLFDNRKHYRWYGDSIQDVVLFLEKLGYDYILYNILTDNIEISIYRKNRATMGCNIHSFDSGLIAGFLGAARGDFVRVTETSCCNNGGKCCKFTTAPSPGDPFCANLDNIAKLFGLPRSEGWVRQEYQILMSAPLMKPEYAPQINSIMAHLGSRAVGSTEKGKVSATLMEGVSRTMERFGLGSVDYTFRPQKISVRLDGAKAKKEFVDISISFLNGMIGSRFGKPLKAQLSSMKKGSYKITMKQ